MSTISVSSKVPAPAVPSMKYRESTMIFRTVVMVLSFLVSGIFDGVGEALSVVKPGRDGAVNLLRPLLPEVFDRERREDGRDRVVHLRYRPECSVGVRGAVRNESRNMCCLLLYRRPATIGAM